MVLQGRFYLVFVLLRKMFSRLPLLPCNNAVLWPGISIPQKEILSSFQELSRKQESWLLQIQLWWLCLTSFFCTVSKPCSLFYISLSPCSNRDVSDFSYLKESNSLKKKSHIYSLHHFLNNLFNISLCLWKHSISKSNCVTQYIFTPFEIKVFYILRPRLPISVMEEYQ